MAILQYIPNVTKIDEEHWSIALFGGYQDHGYDSLQRPVSRSWQSQEVHIVHRWSQESGGTEWTQLD